RCEDARGHLEVGPDGMSDVDLEELGQVLDLLGNDLFAVAIALLGERNGHAEDVGSEVEAGTQKRGVGVVGKEQHAREEDRELLVLSKEIEVEVLDPEQRK